VLANDVINAILSDSTVASYLDDYGSGKAFFYGYLAPNDYQGTNYILYYYTRINIDEYELYSYTLNCRANNLKDSIMLAKSIVQVAHRQDIAGAHCVATQLQTVKPSDENDLFNTPILITVRRRV